MPLDLVCTGCGQHFTVEFPCRARKFCTMACYDAARGPRLEFWDRIDRSAGPDACWPWTGKSRHRFGYGLVRVAKKTITAARRAYELTHGPIAEGLVVRHRCDNPACCNPTHLEVGTKADNNRDTWERGPHPWKHNNPARRHETQEDEDQMTLPVAA